MILERSLSGTVRYYLAEIEDIYDFTNSIVEFIKDKHSHTKKEINNSKSNWIKFWDEFSEKIIRNESSRLFKMVHISLIELFEAFNKDFFTCLLSARPNCMRTKKEKLSYEEIIQFETIEELHEFLALQITDQFGRQNIDQYAEFINTKFNIDLTSKCKNWKKLREIYYRRNLVVHNKSRISNDYIGKINGLGPNDIDRELKINYAYIVESFDHIWKYIEFIFKEIVDKFKLKVVHKNVFDLGYPDDLLFESEGPT